MIRASSLHRLFKCPSSAVLPAVNEESSEYAEAGTALHGYLRAIIDGDSFSAALERLPEALRASAAALPIDKMMARLPDSLPITERAYCYDPLTDTAATVEDYRDGLPSNVYGTLDVAYVDDPTPTFVDWKTGARFVEHPRSNWQMRAYALMLARAHNVRTVNAVIVRMPEDAPAVVLAHTFDGMELDDIADSIRDLVLNKIPAARANPAAHTQLGEHCGYCPARHSCPAQAAVAQALVPLADRVNELTPDKLGALYEQATAVEKMAAKVKEHVKARVLAGERIALPDGRVLQASSYVKAAYTVKETTVTQVRAVKESE